MFIDVHAHAYRHRPPAPAPRFCTPEQVLQRYDAAGIERGVLLPIVSPEIYLPQANEDILEMAERWPDRFIPFCNIDPRALTNNAEAPLERLLGHYRDQGCRGLGEVMPNLPLLDPLVQNLFRAATEVGLPVVFDGSDQVGGDFGLFDETGLPQLEATLERYPDLTVLGHGPIFWSEIGPLDPPPDPGCVFRPRAHQTKRPRPSGPITADGAMVRLLRRFPNLHGDLSDWNPWNALSRDPDYGARFLTEFQDRLLFGTDLVSFEMPFDMVDLLLDWRATGRITEAVFQKVARDNAVRLLNLG